MITVRTRNPENANRPADVLDALLANIGELDAEILAHLFHNGRCDADAARLRERFEPLCDPFEKQSFDIWHDRAVFHFLTEQSERVAYVRQVEKAVKLGGHVIVATFGPKGPLKCSGLDVMRYDAEALHGEFGRAFELVDHLTEDHKTPGGTVQQFVYCYCRLLRPIVAGAADA